MFKQMVNHVHFVTSKKKFLNFTNILLYILNNNNKNNILKPFF